MKKEMKMKSYYEVGRRLTIRTPLGLETVTISKVFKAHVNVINEHGFVYQVMKLKGAR